MIMNLYIHLIVATFILYLKKYKLASLNCVRIQKKDRKLMNSMSPKNKYSNQSHHPDHINSSKTPHVKDNGNFTLSQRNQNAKSTKQSSVCVTIITQKNDSDYSPCLEISGTSKNLVGFSPLQPSLQDNALPEDTVAWKSPLE